MGIINSICFIIFDSWRQLGSGIRSLPIDQNVLGSILDVLLLANIPRYVQTAPTVARGEREGGRARVIVSCSVVLGSIRGGGTRTSANPIT